MRVPEIRIYLIPSLQWSGKFLLNGFISTIVKTIMYLVPEQSTVSQQVNYKKAGLVISVHSPQERQQEYTID